ncbi:MAG: hypothetical protein KF858_13315 [Candidatus Sumerlaeia bacterium]|nr:hypothetical protein [Candidatus Sumerlaeia bacterium]
MRMRHTTMLLGLGLLASVAATIALHAQDEESIDGEAVVEEYVMTDQEYVDDIGTTVEDIESLIQLPPRARLTREADEDPTNPNAIFASREAREALLGQTPAFVYIPVGMDPMIIPWIREQIVVREKLEDAERLLQEARNTRNASPAQTALAVVRELQASYPDSERSADMGRLAQQIEEFLTSPIDAPPDDFTGPGVEPPPPLPEWIRRNTLGVVLDREYPAESVVLVGDFILRRGDRIERFPTVVVKDILPQQVVFEYQGVEHGIQVQPY